MCQAEVTAAKGMTERVQDDDGIWPRKVIGDTGYGSAEMLAWLAHERDIEQNISAFDKFAHLKRLLRLYRLRLQDRTAPVSCDEHAGYSPNCCPRVAKSQRIYVC